MAAPSTLDPKDGVVLPPAVSKDLLHQCSRAAPQGFQGIWTPNATQIRELEDRLPAALQAELTKHDERFRKYASQPTLRQYAGFVLSGRKVIYVNTLPRSAVENASMPARFKPDWRNRPDLVCDGGPVFFGVEYDPAAKTFAHFAFNGPL